MFRSILPDRKVFPGRHNNLTSWRTTGWSARASAPRDGGLGSSFGVVMVGTRDGQPRAYIAVIFSLQSQRIVFGVTGDKNLAPIAPANDVDAGLGRFG